MAKNRLSLDGNFDEAPVNAVSYRMEPDVESTQKALKRTSKKVLAIKPHAAEKVTPERSVFEYNNRIPSF